MQRFVVLLGLASLLVLPACQSGMANKDAEVASQESVMIDEEAAVAQQPIPSEQETAAITQEPQASDMAVTQQSREADVTAAQQAQTMESSEFYGQAPKFENVSEKVVLQAKNGNVTFTHRDHAKQMDCKTCHAGTPGKMADFNKDKGHALCIGCHKEKGAGPTKCAECHKK